MFKMLFAANWKTTLAGLVGGLLTAIAEYLASGQQFTWKTFVSFLGVTIIGYFSKDADKTGAAETIKKPTA